MVLTRLIVSRVRRYWGWILAALLCQLGATLAVLSLPTLNATIIDRGIAAGNPEVIWQSGSVMVGATLLNALCAISGVYFGATAAMRFGRDLRREVYTKVISLSTLQTTEFGAGTLITRGTNDVQQLQMLVLVLINYTVAVPIACVGGVVMALRNDPGLSWVMWLTVALLGVLVTVAMWQLVRLFRSMQGRIDTLNSVLREQIMGLRVVRAFVRERDERQRFDRANRSITEVSIKIARVFVLMFPLAVIVMQSATAAALWFGAQRVGEGAIEVGALTAFVQYLTIILGALLGGVFVVLMLPRAMVCAERLTQLAGTAEALEFPADPVAATPARGRLTLRDVSFRFPGAERPVIDSISCDIGAGSTTAIIGSTGAGKSVLLSLLLRLSDPERGEITIDGTPLPALTKEQLVRTFALVPQQQYLFSGTVASNLRLGRPDASDDELWQALEWAQADEFVRAMDGGLDAPISQGGTSVSGGQRQRLAIARALVAKPLVYVFDDSFSALDVATDAKLRRTLRRVIPNATKVIVAQRVATVLDADQILVLDHGRLVGAGTHEQLLQDSEVYREIVTSQLEPEEASA